MDSISLIINTERGTLEGQSKMLIESIRQFGGRFKDVPIYSYQPRKDFRVSTATLSFFEKHQVNYIDIPLNINHIDYPLANKIYASAHAEKHLNSETIVFMDSDTVVWQEPTAFYELGNHDVAMTPVFLKLGLAASETDEAYHYWQKIQEVLKIPLNQYVNTIVDNQRVLAYYNGGLTVSKRRTGFFQSVHNNFERLLQEDSSFFKHVFMEQVNLSATILSSNLNFLQLGKGYNYPLKDHGNVKNPMYRLETLDEVITGHYTVLFKRGRDKNLLKGELVAGEKGEWFRRKAIEHGVYKP